MKLLVVDDDVMMRRALARTLQSLGGEGCVVAECGDGMEAYALLTGRQYDCAFLDYRMPGRDGLEVLRGVRAAGVQTPIVILTGEGSEELAVAMMKAGATDYLVKGRVTTELLGRTLRNAIRLREAELRAAAAIAQQRDSEERFSRLVEAAEEGVWILDAQGITTFVNPGAAAMIGYQAEEIVGRSPLDFIMDEASRESTRMGLQRRRQGFRERRECVMRHRDGSPVWTIVSAAPLLGSAGGYRGSFAVLTDITHEKRAEQALRESEERFRKIFEDSPMGMGLIDLNRRITMTNSAFARMVGRDVSELIGMRSTDLVHTEDAALDEESFNRLRRGEIPSYKVEKRYVHLNGEIRWGALTMFVIRDAAGRPSSLLGMIEDIHERRLATEALKASEARLRLLFESSPLGISLSFGQTTFYVNPTYVRMFGYDRQDEIVGLPISRRLAPSCRQEVLDRIGRLQQQGSGQDSYEATGLRRDGSEFPYHVRITLIQVPEGTATLAFITDLTEQKQAQEALARTSRTLETVFIASPLAIAVLDRDGTVRMWNPAAERIYGWSAQEAVGRPLSELTLAGGTDSMDEWYARLLAGQRFEGVERPRRRKDGTMIDVRISAAPLHAGEDAGIVLVCSDITESNRMRERLSQTQKMESLGRLAGGISHDFNNLLAVISGYAESLQRKIPEEHPGRPHLEEIERAAERGARLVRQLLAFSRSRPVQTERVDLCGVITGVCTMLRQLIGRKIAIEHEADPRAAMIDADPGQLEQMLVNLALNARDAMPEGGTLKFATKHIDVPEVPGSHPAGAFVLLIVSDTGNGMDAATQSRIFEPFFTTKGEGTGLGLAIVYGVVRQQGGHISVHSEPGKGTRFEILLPAAGEEKGGSTIHSPPARV